MVRNFSLNDKDPILRMKYSQFNNSINLSYSYGLIYNSYTNMYILLRKKQYLDFLTLPIIEFEYQYPKLYKLLLKAGCIIENDIDEIHLLQERISLIDNQNKNYLLTVNPTMDCNFKCWYCYENRVTHSKMSIDILNRIQKHITHILINNNFEKMHLGFFGGEPLLYYKDVVHPLMQHLKQECKIHNTPYSISFTTNGYLLTDFIVEELKAFQVSSMQITLDGGREAHNKVRYPYMGGDSYIKIVENIKKLLYAGISVILRINYTIENMDTILTVSEDFATLPEIYKKYLLVDFHQVWQDSENNEILVDMELLEKCKKTFEINGIAVSASIMDQVWNSCYADKKYQAVINYNGDVYKCTARDFNLENRLGVLKEDGLIVWDENRMKSRQGVRLSKDVCQQCRIAPICGGTCTQREIDSGTSNQCIRGLEESGKDNIVLNQFYYCVVKNEVSI